jgi:hypothetical protein
MFDEEDDLFLKHADGLRKLTGILTTILLNLKESVFDKIKASAEPRKLRTLNAFGFNTILIEDDDDDDEEEEEKDRVDQISHPKLNYQRSTSIGGGGYRDARYHTRGLMVSTFASKILDDETVESLKRTMQVMLGLYKAKVADTSKKFHLVEVKITLVEFNSKTNDVLLDMQFKHCKSWCFFKDRLTVSVLPLAHVSQNLVFRFFKLMRSQLSEEVDNLTNNYMVESDFMLDGLPVVENWEEHGFREVDSILVQEIRRMIVAYFTKKSQIWFGCLGMTFHPAISDGIMLNTMLNYFSEKIVIEAFRIKRLALSGINTSDEKGEDLLDLNKGYFGYLEHIPVFSNSNYSPRSLSRLNSPLISPKNGSRVGRSNLKRKGFVLTNQSLKPALGNQSLTHHYMKTKEELAKILGWEDYLIEDNPAFRHDKLVIGIRPLEVFPIKFESEFYIGSVDILCPQKHSSSFDLSANRSYILSDFKIRFKVMTRSGEELQKVELDSLSFSKYVDMTPAELMKYFVMRVARGVVRHKIRNQFCLTLISKIGTIWLMRSGHP